jgi:tellurite resistance protein
MTNHHAALIYTMVLASAADSDMTDSELKVIGDLVKHLLAFRYYDENLLPETAGACAEMLSEKDGLDSCLDLIREWLPDTLTTTAYLLACDVAAADGAAQQEELRLLELIRHRLDVDRLTAAAIERSARARFATV